MYQENPLSAELGFREDLFDMGRNMLGKAFEAFPDQGPTLEVEGEKYQTSSTLKWPGDNRYWPGRIQTTALSSDRVVKATTLRLYLRFLESFIPTEHTLGLTVGDLTPAAAGLGMSLVSCLTARESADTWKRFTGEKLSVSTLVRLTTLVRLSSAEAPDGVAISLWIRQQFMRVSIFRCFGKAGEVFRTCGSSYAEQGSTNARKQRKNWPENAIL